MEHHATVAHIPSSTAGRLVARETVFYPQAVMRKRLLVINMAKLIIEVGVVVVAAFQHAIFYPKSIEVVVVEVVPRDFDVPAREVFSVEKLNPIFVGLLVAGSKKYQAEAGK